MSFPVILSGANGLEQNFMAGSGQKNAGPCGPGCLCSKCGLGVLRIKIGLGLYVRPAGLAQNPGPPGLGFLCYAVKARA
jgi:hypothetical protein